MLRTDSDPKLRDFDPVSKFFHWLTLFLVAAIFVLAFSIRFATSSSEAATLTQLHRSFGVTVWVVMLSRLVWRQFSRFPNWPADMPRAMRFAAQWSEYALYGLMLIQPILGVLQTNAHGDRLNLFLLGELPTLIGKDRPFAKQLLDVHQTTGLLLLGLIALHASAALYHHFWRGDDTLNAMLPRALRSRRSVVRRLDTPAISIAAIAIILLASLDPWKVAFAETTDDEAPTSADIAAAAGTAAGIGEWCGIDIAPISSAFEELLTRAKLDSTSEHSLLRQYKRAETAALSTPAIGNSESCAGATSIIRDTVHSLMRPAS